MAFDYPPSILGGISRPDVIQEPGAGQALAGGLGQVLAAILQKKLNDQQTAVLQSQMAQRAAETDQATAGATEARARGGLYGEQTADLQRKSKQADLDQKNQQAAQAAIVAHPEVLTDPNAFNKFLSTLGPSVAPHAVKFRDELMKGNQQVFDTQKSGTDASVAAAQAPSKILDAHLDQMFGDAVSTQMKSSPAFRRIAAYAHEGMLPYMLEQMRQAGEDARTDKTANRQSQVTDRTNLRDSWRLLMQQNSDDLKMQQGYTQNRLFAAAQGKDALKEFDTQNPPVNQQTLEAYHATQSNMDVPSYRQWRKKVMSQGMNDAIGAVQSVKLAPDEQQAVSQAVQMIRSGRGSLDQWRQHVQSQGMNPALVAEVTAQLGGNGQSALVGAGDRAVSALGSQ